MYLPRNSVAFVLSVFIAFWQPRSDATRMYISYTFSPLLLYTVQMQSRKLIQHTATTRPANSKTQRTARSRTLGCRTFKYRVYPHIGQPAAFGTATSIHVHRRRKTAKTLKWAQPLGLCEFVCIFFVSSRSREVAAPLGAGSRSKQQQTRKASVQQRLRIGCVFCTRNVYNLPITARFNRVKLMFSLHMNISTQTISQILDANCDFDDNSLWAALDDTRIIIVCVPPQDQVRMYTRARRVMWFAKPISGIYIGSTCILAEYGKSARVVHPDPQVVMFHDVLNTFAARPADW